MNNYYVLVSILVQRDSEKEAEYLVRELLNKEELVLEYNIEDVEETT